LALQILRPQRQRLLTLLKFLRRGWHSGGRVVGIAIIAGVVAAGIRTIGRWIGGWIRAGRIGLRWMSRWAIAGRRLAGGLFFKGDLIVAEPPNLIAQGAGLGESVGRRALAGFFLIDAGLNLVAGLLHLIHRQSLIRRGLPWLAIVQTGAGALHLGLSALEVLCGFGRDGINIAANLIGAIDHIRLLALGDARRGRIGRPRIELVHLRRHVALLGHGLIEILLGLAQARERIGRHGQQSGHFTQRIASRLFIGGGLEEAVLRQVCRGGCRGVGGMGLIRHGAGLMQRVAAIGGRVAQGRQVTQRLGDVRLKLILFALLNAQRVGGGAGVGIGQIAGRLRRVDRVIQICRLTIGQFTDAHAQIVGGLLATESIDQCFQLGDDLLLIRIGVGRFMTGGVRIAGGAGAIKQGNHLLHLIRRQSAQYVADVAQGLDAVVAGQAVAGEFVDDLVESLADLLGLLLHGHLLGLGVVKRLWRRRRDIGVCPMRRRHCDQRRRHCRHHHRFANSTLHGNSLR
jgi:hypothetical protein